MSRARARSRSNIRCSRPSRGDTGRPSAGSARAARLALEVGHLDLAALERVHRVQPRLGSAAGPSHSRISGAEVRRSRPRRTRPSLRIAAPRSVGQDAAPVDDEPAQLRHRTPSRARREQAGHARRPASRRTGRRPCRRASGGSDASSRTASFQIASVTNQAGSPASRAGRRSPSGPPARPGSGSRGRGGDQVAERQPLARLRPEREQVAEVGPRVADRGHLPVDDRGDPRAHRVPGDVDDHVVQLEVAVHERRLRTPRAGGRAASRARRRSRAARAPCRRLRRPRAGCPRAARPSGAAGGRGSRRACPMPGGDERLASRRGGSRRATSTRSRPSACCAAASASHRAAARAG